MDNVTVRCACKRQMVSDNAAARGTYRCGCGAGVIVQIEDRPVCSSAADNGDRCRMVPVREASILGLSLCRDHFARIAEMFETLHVGEAEVALLDRELKLDEREQRLKAYEADVRNLVDQWSDDTATARRAMLEWRRRNDNYETAYVYYIRLGELIKIGFTGDFKTRMNVLMPDEVLAVEPGNSALERERHKQFKHLKVRGERFQSAPDLLAHISEIRTQHASLIGQLPRYAALSLK